MFIADTPGMSFWSEYLYLLDKVSPLVPDL